MKAVKLEIEDIIELLKVSLEKCSDPLLYESRMKEVYKMCKKPFLDEIKEFMNKIKKIIIKYFDVYSEIESFF